MPRGNDKTRVTAYLDAETAYLLKRIGQQEFRSDSSTLALLIRLEAARRGMLGRAPELVGQRRGDGTAPP
jgi:hypothetical protein